MKRLSPLFPLLLIAGMLAGPARAETGYVTDSCTIPIRRGTSTRYKILLMAPSGTPLEILESSSAEGYAKVKTPEGTVGWILSRYLMDQPAPRDQVARLEARIATLEEENNSLRGQAGALDASRAELARCGEEVADIRRAAAQALAIEQENRNLQRETALARDQAAHLERENASLRKESQRDWFVAGAGVGFGGLLLGLIIPNFSWRRQRRRWEQF
ncbi:MAG: TIGR04211 family SH3 domain-containing protein [Candidatus Competibacter sp.]|nr:TIGR04211 family SH3 domain-containing protein [Candidatus Competibacter sp.]MDG4583975.1 TIGR04211 family SH3 domain-containing protein [Candidatus Competibacter sp.]